MIALERGNRIEQFCICKRVDPAFSFRSVIAEAVERDFRRVHIALVGAAFGEGGFEV